MIISTLILLSALVLSLNVMFRVKLLHRTWHTPNGYSVTCILSRLSNVYLVRGNGITVLVDTGLASRRAKLLKRLRHYGVERIDYLLLTHAHFDHVGNAAYLRQPFGAQVVAHSSEAELLATGQSAPFVPATRLWLLLLRSARSFAPAFEPCAPNLKFDAELTIPGTHISLHHTPGHTPGSSSVLVDDTALLTGDALLGIFNFSINNPFAISAEDMRSSWKTLADMGARVLLPGHGSLKRPAHLRRALRRAR